MQRRNIAFYSCSNCYGGLEKNILQIIEWLTNEHNNVLLLSPKEHTLSKVAAERNIPVIFAKKSIRCFGLIKAWNLSRTICRNRIDILIIIRPADILVASLTKRVFCRNLKLVFLQQSKLHFRRQPLLYSLLFGPYNAWIIPFAHFRNEAIKMARYKPEQLHVIPPCIDVDYYENDTLTLSAARKLLDLPEKRYIFGCLGKFDLKRKQDFLIRTVHLLSRYKHDIDLLAMGKTDDTKNKEYFTFLQELVAELHVEKNVHFRPHTDKLITFFKAIDFFIMNWPGEPYDLILVKAMASGVPVIARYSNTNTEVLENGKYGLLYKANDLEDFSSKTIHLLTQPRLANHLKQEATKMVREQYDIENGCRQMNELISKL